MLCCVCFMWCACVCRLGRAGRTHPLRGTTRPISHISSPLNPFSVPSLTPFPFPPSVSQPPSSPRPSLPSTRRRDRAQRARGRLIEDEGKETHDLPPSSNKARPWSVYVAYFSACGPATLPLCLALSAAFMV